MSAMTDDTAQSNGSRPAPALPGAVAALVTLYGTSPLGTTMVAEAWRIGSSVAAVHAADVDAAARFPHESMDALRSSGLMGALIPPAYGGPGASLRDVAAVCCALGQHCGSTAMIYAMHQIQVACLVNHGAGVAALEAEMRAIAKHGNLMGSATTELGVGGDVRTSLCHVVVEGDRFHLNKNTPVISYGEYADSIMVTARRNAEAANSDQVIVLTHKVDTQLQRTGTWDTIGMRGTCSVPFVLDAVGDASQIVPEPYAVVSSRTMLPTTHIVWAALWLGIATDAVNKARAYLRAQARKQIGSVPTIAADVALLFAKLDTARATLTSAIALEEACRNDPDLVTRPSTTLRFNALKTQTSTAVVDIVNGALQICGISGYKNDTPYAMGRLLRDAHSAALMVHNERILSNSGALLCISKED